MPEWTISQFLFYGGIAGIGVSVLVAILAAILFRITGKHIRTRLDREYGKPRR